MIELRLIRYALALGKHRNYARAAKALNITQPTLTRSIHALERLLELTLFDRSHKGITPTPFGRVFLERGEMVLNREFDLRRELRLMAGLEVGLLAVSAGPYLAETTVASAIARVARTHPKLRIRCTLADPVEVVGEVLAERVDVGVAGIFNLENEDRLIVEALPSQRIYFTCRPGHPLTIEDSVSVARALEFPVVTTVLRGAHAALARNRGLAKEDKGAQVADVEPQISVNSVVLARLIARESDALFPGTSAMISDDVAAGRLVALDCEAPAMRTSSGVFYLRGRTLSPAALLFIEALRAESQQEIARIAGATSGKPRRGLSRRVRRET
jgi:DNA-binding transcriptional LysR family regulator